MTPLNNVHPAIHIGNDDDAHKVLLKQRTLGQPWSDYAWPGWAIVHAAKNPWHADMVGYPSGPAPEGPEQYSARRDRRMALNLVDSLSQLSALVLPILTTASDFISEQIDAGNSVLVHCNQGYSRSPAVVLWWMHCTVPNQPYTEALSQLLEDCPLTRTDTGIMTLVHDSWSPANVDTA